MTDTAVEEKDEVQDQLEGRDAFVKRLDGTFEKYESIVLMREDLFKLQKQVDRLLDSGMRYSTVIILLHHHTKIPQKTIRKVLEGLREVPLKYFKEEE